MSLEVGPEGVLAEVEVQPVAGFGAFDELGELEVAAPAYHLVGQEGFQLLLLLAGAVDADFMALRGEKTDEGLVPLLHHEKKAFFLGKVWEHAALLLGAG